MKNNPTIILITGASHTGKTLPAQKMLERYGYPYLSIDHLKMGLIRSGKTSLTPEDDDALTEYLWPIVWVMVKTAIENKQNLIVLGCRNATALHRNATALHCVWQPRDIDTPRPHFLRNPPSKFYNSKINC